MKRRAKLKCTYCGCVLHSLPRKGGLCPECRAKEVAGELPSLPEISHMPPMLAPEQDERAEIVYLFGEYWADDILAAKQRWAAEKAAASG